MLSLFRSEITRLMLLGFLAGSLAVGAIHGVAQADPGVQSELPR